MKLCLSIFATIVLSLAYSQDTTVVPINSSCSVDREYEYMSSKTSNMAVRTFITGSTIHYSGFSTGALKIGLIKEKTDDYVIAKTDKTMIFYDIKATRLVYLEGTGKKLEAKIYGPDFKADFKLAHELLELIKDKKDIEEHLTYLKTH